MLNRNLPWGLLFGGNQCMIFRLVPQSAQHCGGLVCSGVLQTTDNATPLMSLLVYMLLQEARDSPSVVGSPVKIPLIQVPPKIQSTRALTLAFAQAKDNSAEGTTGQLGGAMTKADNLQVCLLPH